jgi:hypothetical protein
VVAAGVADAGIADAVGLVDGLLEDLRPGGAQRLERLVQVVDLDEDRQVPRATISRIACRSAGGMWWSTAASSRS